MTIAHPFTALSGEYAGLLARMQVTRPATITAVAEKLVSFARQGRYADVSAKTGIPQAFMATSFEREAASNFHLSPAQGDPLDRVSVHVPRGRGPYPNWTAAALDAYHIDALDQVGKDNWSEERFCFEGELFNGFGYRTHGVHSPYLWAGTNNYSGGKFVADGKFSSAAIDSQLGIVPVMRRMLDLAPDLSFATGLRAAAVASGFAPVPIAAPDGVGTHGDHDTRWLQDALNRLHVDGTPLTIDGSYGRRTRAAVRAFQAAHGLDADGLAGPLSAAAIERELTA